MISKSIIHSAIHFFIYFAFVKHLLYTLKEYQNKQDSPTTWKLYK